MIEQGDAEQLTCFAQPLGHAAILGAGRGVAGRMVVRDGDRRRAQRDRGREHFARMHRRRVAGADVDNVYGERTVSPVEVDGDEVLARIVADERADESRDVAPMANRVGLWRGFADEGEAHAAPGVPLGDMPELMRLPSRRSGRSGSYRCR